MNENKYDKKSISQNEVIKLTFFLPGFTAFIAVFIIINQMLWLCYWILHSEFDIMSLHVITPVHNFKMLNSQFAFHIKLQEAAIALFHPSGLQTSSWLADHFQPIKATRKRDKSLID